MDIRISIAPLAQIARSVVNAMLDPLEGLLKRLDDRAIIREKREDIKREAELDKVQANWDRAQKNSDDSLAVFRDNRALYERQAKALERLAESVEYIAKAMAVMNERSASGMKPTGAQPTRKART